MNVRVLARRVVVLLLVSAVPAAGQTPAPSSAVPAIKEYLEVIATREAAAPDTVPAAIEVLGGDELRSRGARDLASALRLATGVDVAPGGDGGPAASVPELWGLREFDAFLLVVDDVPWGGAFNPALATLSLEDVDRIEVLRGPAAVTYGAASFVGVIHVVHRRGAQAPSLARIRGGSYGSGGASFATSLGLPWDSRLVVDADREGFRDARTAFTRGHATWRNSHRWGAGRVLFDVDATALDQHPASPHPRQGSALAAQVPLDANHNPADAFLNERRAAASLALERPLGDKSWTTTVSIARATQDVLRGFLTGLTATDNARGVRAQVAQVELYADSHLQTVVRRGLHLVAGADLLHGEGEAHGADFTYTAPLDGRTAPIASVPAALDIGIDDRRDFFGGYALMSWQALPRLSVSGGLRLNVANEERERGDGGEVEPAGEEEGADRTDVRPAGSLGVVFTPWQAHADRLRLYANYRDTFKPPASDFNIAEGEGDADAEERGGLLKPETARSVEAGAKLRTWRGRLWLDAGVFLMDFENLVVARTVNGLPGLINAGTQRFSGLETGAVAQVSRDVSVRASYSFHDAHFRDFVFEFDGVPTQLEGKRLEMSARHVAAGGLLYAPGRGPLAALEVKYVGSRFLNKRNTALADGYATVDASVGYRVGRWEARLDGRNLTNQRAPVAESELGDAQYYRLPSRRLDVSLGVRF
jgi:outer membrane receptor protein involved in Fe transport